MLQVEKLGRVRDIAGQCVNGQSKRFFAFFRSVQGSGCRVGSFVPTSSTGRTTRHQNWPSRPILQLSGTNPGGVVARSNLANPRRQTAVDGGRPDVACTRPERETV